VPDAFASPTVERRASTMTKYHEHPPSVAGHDGLSSEDFERAGVRAAERRFGARDLIFAPGDSGAQLYFVLEGMVRLYKIYGDSREATVALLTRGDVFGEPGLGETKRQDAFAETMVASRVAVVRKPNLVEAVKRNPEFALGLFSSFSRRLGRSEETIESLLDREVSARLATLLSHLAGRFGEPDGPATALSVRLTHQDLASMVASTREAVSKVMSEFRRAGLIEVRGRRISVSPRLAETRLDKRFSVPGAA
jgi:CRP/FNR family transcriptional regulator, global nitrogen regulator